MRSDKIEIRRLKIVMGNCKVPQAFGFSVLYNLTRLHWRWLQPCMHTDWIDASCEDLVWHTGTCNSFELGKILSLVAC